MYAARSAVASGDGSSFARAGQRFLHDAVGIALLSRKVEQHHRHARVDEMRGDLRAHHAGAETATLRTRNGGVDMRENRVASEGKRPGRPGRIPRELV
jgi:hypothetical protein